MARGKQARRAELRRDAAETETTIATYQRRVTQLTAEVRELGEKLARQDRAAKAVERRLRAERDEGTAPQVQALSLALEAAVRERDAARRTARDEIETKKKLALAMTMHFGEEHRWPVEESLQWVYCVIGDLEPGGIFPVDSAEDRALAACKTEEQFTALRRKVPSSRPRRPRP